MRKFIIGYTLVAISSLGVLVAGNAQAEGVISQVHVAQRPSNLGSVTDEPNTHTFHIACYGRSYQHGSDGSWQPINCSFTLWVSLPPGEASDPQVNGGHLPFGHTGGLNLRPLVYRQRHVERQTPVYDGPGELKYPYDMSPDNNLRVTGETMPLSMVTRADIEYPIPEVAGQAQLDAQITLPHGWVCLSSCYTSEMWWRRYKMHFRVPGLVELPDPGPDDHYLTGRNIPDPAHPNSVAFHLKSEHIPTLRTLADEYHENTQGQRTLSLNDLSLPLGGPFDIHGDWSLPHRSHREGADADVNQAGIPCLRDRQLIKAARVALPKLRDQFGTGGNTDSAILCESGGRKHIDFER